ncbi:spore coat U domain-containing protein [Rhodoferax sediminis]|uniref:Spore coat U domain-containing protein n=1 Tax=Rhodoferax sediminis TaxID=2509614 RepID=A0A515D6D3_9BURK|nr:spore coat U domain-containing protein [Rhodoferax sediminis]QDL35980.1 spore coat U domain-containing protein [Rhodoferax sediminis]
MTRSLQRWLGTLLLISCGMFGAVPAHAAPFSCSATMTTLAFGTVNPLSSQTDASATLSYTCTTNDNSNHYLAACFRIGQGPSDAANANPRRMQAGAGPYLQFQIYQDAARTNPWGSNSGTLGTELYVQVLVPAKGATSGVATLYGRVLAGQTATLPGPYNEQLINNTLNVVDGGSQFPKNCGGGGTNDGSFDSFLVSANVSNSCSVTATNIDLGSVAAAVVNSAVPGTGTIKVTCPSSTVYTVGLLPSALNGGTASGTGNMSGVISGNTDKVPYQLYSDAGYTKVWGNVGTNTVAGTGTGLAQPYTVYPKAPSANYTPDTYSDTVTVNVNY